MLFFVNISVVRGASLAPAAVMLLEESVTEPTRCRAYLKEQLDSLDGSDSCLGDSGGDSSGQKVLGK